MCVWTSTCFYYTIYIKCDALDSYLFFIPILCAHFYCENYLQYAFMCDRRFAWYIFRICRKYIVYCLSVWAPLNSILCVRCVKILHTPFQGKVRAAISYKNVQSSGMPMPCQIGQNNSIHEIFITFKYFFPQKVWKCVWFQIIMFGRFSMRNTPYIHIFWFNG